MKSNGLIIGVIILIVIVGGVTAAVMFISPKPAPAPSGSSGANAPAPSGGGESHSIATIALPTMAESEPVHFEGLHNVVAYHEGFLSGGAPEGEEGMATLAAMGIHTVISVDGAVPDVETAKKYGLKYIHLPIGYNGFDEDRKLELVRAARDALQQGPVYVHCHHGKHRSAGAAGAIAVSLGWMTPEEGVERMKVSGTAPNYTGLYECTADSTAVEPSIIDAVAADFPEVSQPPSFVKAMVEMDEVNDHLKAIEKAGWKAPADHPDLVPVAEAARLVDLFRFIEASQKAKTNGDDFIGFAMRDQDRAQSIEDMLYNDPVDAVKLSEQFKLIQTSCKECHAKYRDIP